MSTKQNNTTSSCLLTTEAKDLTNGMNHIIFEIRDTVSQFSIKLGTNHNVKIDSTDQNTFSCDQVFLNDDSSELVIKPTTSSIQSILGTYKLRLTATNDIENISKDLYISFREYVSDDDSIVESMNYAKNIGKGTQIVNDIGNTTVAVFDFSSIAALLQKNESLKYDSKMLEILGDDYQTSTNKLGAKLGINVLGKALSVGFSSDYSKEVTTTTDFEFYMSYIYKNMCETQLNTDDTSDNILQYLDQTCNNILNNPSTDLYKKYTLDKQGAFDFFNKYGTHVITEGCFGGYYSFQYCRKQNSYEKSIAADANASAKEYDSTDSNGNITTLADAIISCFGDSEINSTEASASTSSSDYKEASRAVSVIRSKGGQATTDFTIWDQSFTADKDNWVLCSYSIDNGSSNGGLVPIYELCIDDDRKQILSQYMEEYINSLMADPTTSDLVIVDFMMKKGSNGHKSGEPKMFIQSDPWNIKRMYYPIMANEYAEKDHGYAMETSQNPYVVASDNTDQYWYYALGYRSEGYGITDAEIAKSNKIPSGYTARGNHANDGITGALDNNYVCLKFVKDAQNNSKLITAIGLSTEDKKHVMACSGGAEWAEPFSNNQKDFDNFWNGATYKSTQWFKGLSHRKIYLAYSTKTLYKDFKHDGDSSTKVIQPKKWGDQ